MKEYFQKMYKKTKNPVHKEYYKNLLFGYKSETLQKKELNLIKRKVYSKKLNKTFDNYIEASQYVRRGKSYAYDVIKRERSNPYGFSFI
jgi:hypothetical protein